MNFSRLNWNPWNPMRAAALVLAVLVLAAPARALDRDALRRLVPLPRVEVHFNFAFADPTGPKVSDDEARLQLAAGFNAARPKDLDRRGQLLYQLKRYDEAKAAYAQAARGWSEQIKARPEDADLLVRLGLSLNGAGQDAEAEARLRRAVAVAPRSADAWIALGKVLLSEATGAVLPSGMSMSFSGAQVQQTAGDAEIMQQRPAEDAIARAQASLDGARAAYDRAVEVAPQDPNAYDQRIGFRMGEGFTRAMLEALRADATATRIAAMRGGAQGMAQGMFSPASSPDLRQIAHLRPDDVQALGAAALFEIIGFARREAEAGHQNEITQLWPLLPEEARASVRFSMERLQVLARPDTRGGAEASEALGILQYLAGQGEDAQKSLRRAIGLDPSRDQAWGLLTSILRESNRFDAMAVLLEEQVRHADTAANRLTLAKAYDKLGQTERVGEQVRAALAREPGDLSANLALAVLLMRGGDASLARAGEQMAQVARLLAPPAEPSQLQTVDYAVLRGFYLALNGQPDAARAQLQAALKSEADNQSAQQALAALDH